MAHLGIEGEVDVCRNDTIHFDLSVIEGALSECPKLEVLVLHRHKHVGVHMCRALIPCEASADMYEDPRLVLLLWHEPFLADPYSKRDWERGARGGEDFWIVAEKIVKAKKGEPRLLFRSAVYFLFNLRL